MGNRVTQKQEWFSSIGLAILLLIVLVLIVAGSGGGGPQPVAIHRAGLFGRIQTLAPVVRLSRTPADVTLPPPALGEHTREILRE